MKTYTFVQKNGSATMYLSANNDDESEIILQELVKDPEEWRFDGVEDE